ncbi:MAG: BON domain-containing protein [Anaerolineae bacterium]|nr:BON domain-containing protein [Anaerolineae bacterium]
MVKYDFNIGAEVTCQDGRCGRLHKVVVDPSSKRVTDLIVERGYLLTTDRVLPVDVVQNSAGDEITLSMTSDDLTEYPEYREIEFEQPDSVVKLGVYKREDMRCWQQNYQVVCHEPVVPFIRRTIDKGIEPYQSVIERGTKVMNVVRTLGYVDHVLVDPKTDEITHVVMRRGLLPYYPIIPISDINSVSDSGIWTDLSEVDVQTLPRHRKRDAEDIETDIQGALRADAHNYDAVSFEVDGSIVTLTGYVEDVEAMRRAVAIAYSTPGVLGVENKLNTDLSVITRVRYALLNHPRTEIAAVEVVNNNGVITLKGNVDTADIKATAEEIASQQSGVISVINDIRIEPDENVNWLAYRTMNQTSFPTT